jgi:hypothetical protein
MDLFGNRVKKEESLEDEYTAYINSPDWKRVREAKIKQVGGRCQRCGLSKWSVRLEVHHKDYKHFKHERLEDLEVLCEKCHKTADKEREEKTEEKWENSPLIRGFENWMDKGNNPGWRKMNNNILSRQWGNFLKTISRNSGKKYTNAFKRSSKW